MAQVQLENQVTTEEEKSGHIVVAAWTDNDPTMQHTITQKLMDNGKTYAVIHKAPSPRQIVDQAADESANALVCVLNTVADRGHVYKLVAYCRRQQFYIPILLLGEAADPQYAQILALPEHGDFYQGGIYFCEDVAEMEQVLKHIILFTPPPVEHEHDQEHADAFSCSDCGGCADNCALNQGW